MASEGKTTASPAGPDLRPPDSQLHAEPGQSGKQVLLWAALIGVVVAGLAVVLVLPKLVTEPADRTNPGIEKQVTKDEPRPSEASAVQLPAERGNAEQALQQFLHVRARLELANAPLWGEPEWSVALEQAARGNDLFVQRQFSAAGGLLKGAVDGLLSLESEAGRRLDEALRAGWQALDADDGAQAKRLFERALAIDADNEEALEGLARAAVRADVLALMVTGESALARDDLPAARDAYQQVVDLDDAYQPAVLALKSVTERITELAFRDAMTRALGALEKRQTAAAEAALRQAESLKPGDESVRNLRQELVQLEQTLWLADQRRNAAAFESGEDWSRAAEIYRKVLARAPQSSFARQGLEFAADRERLNRQFDHYLQDPSRLYSDQPRANAQQLIESAGQPPGGEVRLAEKIRRLQNMIMVAETPLTVTLESDGLTEVQIYHVGRLGQFTRQQLELTPGTYTVVGSRPGYRDVRQTLTVKPGDTRPKLVIRCEEPV